MWGEGGDADNPEVPARDNQPKVVMEIPIENGQDLPNGSGAAITVSLIGAVFADRVVNDDLKIMHAMGGRLAFGGKEGGAAGDDFVTFSVTADADIDHDTTAPAGEGITLAFHVPALTETAAAMTSPASHGILVSVDIESASSGEGGFPNYPERNQKIPNRDPETMAMVPTLDDSGIRVLIAKPSAPTAASFGSLGLQVYATQDASQDGVINTEMRESFYFRDPAADQQISVAGVTLGRTAGVHQSDGKIFSVDNRRAGSRQEAGDGAGTLSGYGRRGFAGR